MLVIALDEKRTDEKALLELMGQHFSPHNVCIWKDFQDKELEALIPSIKERTPINGKTAVYICRQDRCEPPLTDFQELRRKAYDEKSW